MTDPPRRRRPRPPRAAPPSSVGADAVYVVDRVEGRIAVLAPDADVSTVGPATIDVAATALPAGCAAEGAVLRVPLDADAAPRWAEAVRDRAEEERRRADARARLDRLRASDPGGDLAL